MNFPRDSGKHTSMPQRLEYFSTGQNQGWFGVLGFWIECSRVRAPGTAFRMRS
jgi:hypothetical protein